MTLDARQELDAAVSRWGEWTDHNIRVSDGVFTIDERIVSEKLRRVLQVVSDLAGKPLSELRILDLACLEGQYACEFAQHGARTVAIEGREVNIRKADLAKRLLGLDNLQLLLGDVRDLARDTHGGFDVVLCLGILYHLDAPDVFSFVEKIAAVCDRLAVFDTYVSLQPKRDYRYNGRQYWGRDIEEHDRRESAADKRAKLWSSIENLNSAWLTKPTLLNLLARCGFTSVYECYVPVEAAKPLDRVTLVAVKGQKAEVMTCPATNAAPEAVLPEKLPVPSHFQRRLVNLRRSMTHLVPRQLRQAAKSRLLNAGIIHPVADKTVFRG